MKTLLVVLALSGCELFVDVPNATLASGSGGDAASACTESTTCVAPTPVCETTNGACVECVLASDCSDPARPFCAQNACRGCSIDAECPVSNVCLGGGSCADPARVLYASTTGAGTACTLGSPCSFDTAIGQVSATSDIVKLAPGVYERPDQLSITRHTIITGEGATLHNAATMLATLMFDVTAVDATFMRMRFDLVNASFQAFGVECLMNGKLTLDRVTMNGGYAAAYASACTLTIDRSQFDGNNVYAVYSINSTLAITNSFITNNGNGSQGGMVLTSSTGTIEHVTLAGNAPSSQVGGAGAIRCNDTGVAIRSSIIFGNADPQVTGCNVTYSISDFAGTSNVAADPLYVAPGTRDYHIQASSPAVGLADPGSHVSHDYDGDLRPQPAGSMADSGADEIP
ncbi:MAG: hypothetical protein ABI678_26620 [Kofleriaceae bacterium]